MQKECAQLGDRMMRASLSLVLTSMALMHGKVDSMHQKCSEMHDMLAMVKSGFEEMRQQQAQAQAAVIQPQALCAGNSVAQRAQQRERVCAGLLETIGHRHQPMPTIEANPEPKSSHELLERQGSSSSGSLRLQVRFIRHQ